MRVLEIRKKYEKKRVQRTNGEIGEEIVEEGNWTNEAKNQGTGEDSK